MSAVHSVVPSNANENGHGRLVTRLADDLRPHPSLVRLQIVPSARELSSAITRREQAFREPLTITQDRYILAGQAEWKLALRREKRMLSCLQLEMTEEEALFWLIQKNQRSSSLNDFSRIRLALELEPWFKARARSNQQLGGRIKGSSNLAEADRVDVRSQIAAAADVSEGNVSKVKSLISAAHPDVLEALREGEVSINLASSWLCVPEKQIDELRLHRNRRGIKRTINSLQSQHRLPRTTSDGRFDISRISRAMLAMAPDQRPSVLVGELQVPGQVLLLSSALLKALESQGEL
jgi:hypothetical protein